MSLLWVNGTLSEKLAAKVSPFDHGFLYGDGVWEHLRVFCGRPLRPIEHLNLMFAAAEALGIVIPLSREEITAAIDTTLKANNRTEGYIRVIVTRGPGTIGPDPRKIDPQVIVIAEEYQPFPQELFSHGLHAAIFPTPLDMDHPANRHRTLGRPHFVLAKQHALRNGCLEAILLNRAGDAVGTTEGFLFAVKDGAVVVAGGQSTDVVGFAVARFAAELRLEVAEYTLKPADLLAAEEVFIAGTACGVIGLVRIDGRDIGKGTEGSITRRLREGYAREAASGG